MFLSIVIPNKNRSFTALRAMLSVLRQEYFESELIVVDDCSNADLSLIYQHVERRGVKVLRASAPVGGAAARNLGVAAASGRYVAFLDSDDIWLPGRIETLRRLVAGAGARPEVLVARFMFLRDGHLHLAVPAPMSHRTSIPDLVYVEGALILTSGIALPTALARQVPFDTDLRVNQDTDLAIRLERAGARFAFEPTIGVIKDDGSSRPRIANDAALIDRSMEWFEKMSPDWSEATKRGFFRHDRVWRLAAAGDKIGAIRTLLRYPDPREGLSSRLKAALRIALGTGACDALGELRGGMGRSSGNAAEKQAAADWIASLENEAAAILRPRPASPFSRPVAASPEPGIVLPGTGHAAGPRQGPCG